MLVFVDMKLCLISSAEIDGRAVVVIFSDNQTLSFEDCWLRDNCRCPRCYHADTFQRANHILDIPETTVVRLRFDNDFLYITWDDQHESKYKASFLYEHNYKTWSDGNRLKPKLWRGDISSKVGQVEAQEFLETQDGAKKVFQSLLDFGVVLITGVEPNLEGTKAICKALGGVQHTLFGGMWQFTTRADHADTAYTNLPLCSHNDNTYFTEAAGLQILHCLEHSNGAGGETTLVDGFHAALRLQEEIPRDFDFLTRFQLQAEYIEKGHHHKYSAPVIVVEKNGDLRQIRFNVYDRAPMAFASSEQCRDYYRSLRSFARIIEDPTSRWQFKLTPGTVLAMDNFHVLHGRTGFSGTRVLCGSYVARSDWLDRCRTLGLIK